MRGFLTISLLSVLAGNGLGAAASEPASAAPGCVVFSELMWMGSAASSADEWIELYNPHRKAFELEGWVITRRDKNGDEIVMLELGRGLLGPGETYLIANYGPAATRSQLAVDPDLITKAVTLPNSKLQLRLYDGTPELGGQLLDTADDGRGAPFAGDRKKKAAMVRVDFAVDGFHKEAWETAREASGWDAVAGEKGTPGRIPPRLLAGPERTAVTAASWSQLKASLRRGGLARRRSQLLVLSRQYVTENARGLFANAGVWVGFDQLPQHGYRRAILDVAQRLD